jgi:uncharacterized protein YjbJ (UPF0337 family)
MTRDSFSNKPKEGSLNKDILEGEWKQMRGKTRAWWGKLTNADFVRIAGKYDILAGTLQVKYGYTRKQAESEIDKRITIYNANFSRDNTVPRD